MTATGILAQIVMIVFIISMSFLVPSLIIKEVMEREVKKIWKIIALMLLLGALIVCIIILFSYNYGSENWVPWFIVSGIMLIIIMFYTIIITSTKSRFVVKEET